MNNIFSDTKVLVLLVLGAVLGYLVVFEPRFAGIALLGALILYGGFSLLWHERHVRITALVILVFLSGLNIALHELNYGIDFKGGTRIPIVLEKPVDELTMSQMKDIIKTRTSILGLSQQKVYAIGDSEIYVEVPFTDQERISAIEKRLSERGSFLAVIDGVEALRGQDIYQSSVGQTPAQFLNSGGGDWGVSFSVTKRGGQKFSDAAKGKGGSPIFFFIDRPEQGVFVMADEDLGTGPSGISYIVARKALSDALRLNGQSILVLSPSEVANATFPENTTKVFVSGNVTSAVRDELSSRGVTVEVIDSSKSTPSYLFQPSGAYASKWPAAGLLDARFLSDGVANGVPSYDFQITGTAQGLNAQERQKSITEQVRYIESVLKGGSLPVAITVGSKTQIPATLGSKALEISVIGILASLAAVSAFIGIRYRKIRFVLPIIAISVCELIILVSFLGSVSTIDLAAIAGIIAAIGVGIDAQIVITDELLKKSALKLEERTGQAFEILKTNVLVAVVGTLPLMFSGLVEVFGFAISTMLGALLGYMISRPAYAVFAEAILGKEAKDEKEHAQNA